MSKWLQWNIYHDRLSDVIYIQLQEYTQPKNQKWPSFVCVGERKIHVKWRIFFNSVYLDIRRAQSKLSSQHKVRQKRDQAISEVCRELSQGKYVLECPRTNALINHYTPPPPKMR